MPLQTALLGTKERASNKFSQILSDRGSQRSIIAKSLSKKLKVKVIVEEQVTVAVLGKVSLQKQNYERVELFLRSQHDSDRSVTEE